VQGGGTFGRSNLDVQLSVLDSNGTVLQGGTFNPTGTNTANGLGIAAATVTLPVAGTYYASVMGAGSSESPQAGGYSAYGSRGRFAITATFPAAATGAESPSPSPSPIAVDSPSPSPNPSVTQSPATWPSPSPSPSLSPASSPSPSPSPTAEVASPSPSPAAVELSPSPSPVVPSPSPATPSPL
jgi:hypothetical protein